MGKVFGAEKTHPGMALEYAMKILNRIVVVKLPILLFLNFYSN